MEKQTTNIAPGNITQRELTFGEYAVGLNFNPSGNEKVARVKELYAEIIDLIEREKDGSNYSSMKRSLKNTAIQQAILSQMSTVKLITWKD